jgi:uncharacterized protein
MSMKSKFLRSLRVLPLLIGLFFSASVFAIELQEAKSLGLVGETVSGYLEKVSGNDEVSKLVASINAQRKAEYQRIAVKNKISVSDVELLAGKKAIEKTPAGQFVKVDGEWLKK